MKHLSEIIKHKNEALFIYGILCFSGALVCFLLNKYSTIQIMCISGVYFLIVTFTLLQALQGKAFIK